MWQKEEVTFYLYILWWRKGIIMIANLELLVSVWLFDIFVTIQGDWIFYGIDGSIMDFLCFMCYLEYL